MMTHWKIIRGGGGLALVLALFASSCSGRVADGRTGLSQDLGLVCSAAVCGSEVRSYDDGNVLVLSPNRMQVSFSPGPVLTDGPQTGDDVAGALALRNVRDGREGDRSAGEPNTLMLAGVEYSLGLPDTDPDGVIDERNVVFCTAANSGDCNVGLGGVNYALGYNTIFRLPGAVKTEDRDIVMGELSIIKTTLSNDYLAFGVGVSMVFQERRSAFGFSQERYRAEEFGSFVFGSRFTADLPTQGLAAYAGFSQAYAQTSSRRYSPFQPPISSGDGGIIGNGYSAMVFSFDGNGASFEHGYIDLNGGTYIDNGVDTIHAFSSRADQDSAYRTNMTLSANFDNPGYRSTSFAQEIASVDPGTYPDSAGFEGNPDTERGYYIRGSANRVGNASHWLFKLEKNDATPGTMDFTMEMILPQGATSCSSTRSNRVHCFHDSTRPDAARAGVAQFYGPTVSLASDSNNADNVPTFVGGVWQYEGIVVLDYGQDETAGGPNPDTLESVVDLYGSFGGLIVDNPACPTTNPTCSPSP